jgi:hypothetical protein
MYGRYPSLLDPLVFPKYANNFHLKFKGCDIAYVSYVALADIKVMTRLSVITYIPRLSAMVENKRLKTSFFEPQL